jgi:hypothetical protein
MPDRAGQRHPTDDASAVGIDEDEFVRVALRDGDGARQRVDDDTLGSVTDGNLAPRNG